MQKIAVQEGLDRIGEYLSGKGYRVETIGFDAVSEVENSDYDAIVLSGMNDNIMGISDTVTKAPVIIATGMTGEMIYQQLQKRLQ